MQSKTVIALSVLVLGLAAIPVKQQVSAAITMINATQLQGYPVSTKAPVAGEFLAYQNGAWAPFSIFTIAQAGRGVCISGSGTLYLCQSIRVVTGPLDSIVASDCGRAITYASQTPVSSLLSQAGIVIPSSCPLRLFNEGSGVVTVTPAVSTIAGAKTFTLPPGTPAHPKFAVFYNDSKNYRVGENN